jgi:hypothetical protein
MIARYRLMVHAGGTESGLTATIPSRMLLALRFASRWLNFVL